MSLLPPVMIVGVGVLRRSGSFWTTADTATQFHSRVGEGDECMKDDEPILMWMNTSNVLRLHSSIFEVSVWTARLSLTGIYRVLHVESSFTISCLSNY